MFGWMLSKCKDNKTSPLATIGHKNALRNTRVETVNLQNMYALQPVYTRVKHNKHLSLILSIFFTIVITIIAQFPSFTQRLPLTMLGRWPAWTCGPASSAPVIHRPIWNPFSNSSLRIWSVDSSEKNNSNSSSWEYVGRARKDIVF